MLSTLVFRVRKNYKLLLGILLIPGAMLFFIFHKHLSIYKQKPKVFGKTVNDLSIEVPPCMYKPAGVNFSVNYVAPTWSDVNDKLSGLTILTGGRWDPPSCQANYSSAIIIPYKDREGNLRSFLFHMHPFLQNQLISYQIFIVEQLDGQAFNRAKLLNIGYAEARKVQDFDCYIMHDIDMLPLNDRNIYKCNSTHPKHFTSSIQKFWWSMPYGVYFGGVCGFTNAQMTKMNGFSNKFWGWGGEDDEAFYRVVKSNQMPIARYATGGTVGLYATLEHGLNGDHSNRGKAIRMRDSTVNLTYHNLKNYVSDNMMTDGINSLRYDILQSYKQPFYTYIYADIHP